jgi:hypothetical protein
VRLGRLPRKFPKNLEANRFYVYALRMRVNLGPEAFRDPKDSLETFVRFEEPAECEGIHCHPPEQDIDPVDFAAAVEALAEYHEISNDEAAADLRKSLANRPTKRTSVHGHIVVYGKDPEASPRWFEVPLPPPVS